MKCQIRNVNHINIKSERTLHMGLIQDRLNLLNGPETCSTVDNRQAVFTKRMAENSCIDWISIDSSFLYCGGREFVGTKRTLVSKREVSGYQEASSFCSKVCSRHRSLAARPVQARDILRVRCCD